jgi:hypothetical protein
MRLHFRDRHINDVITVIEDGVNALPRCQKCGIFQRNVGESHQQTAECKKFALRLEARISQERNEKLAKETVFTVFDEPIETVTEFKYLGRIVNDRDDDKPTIMHNLKKAGKVWGNIHRLLSQEKDRNIKVVVSVYRTIIQALLLYGSETWVYNKKTLQRLEVFHRRCARFLTGQYIRQEPNGEWIYPRTKEVLEKAGLESIETYIQKRKEQVAKYLGPQSKAIIDITNSQNIEVNMETVCWWKPTNPDQ